MDRINKRIKEFSNADKKLENSYKQKLERLLNKLQNENDKILLQDYIDKTCNNDITVINKNSLIINKYNNDNISKIYDKINKISKYISNYKNFEHYSSLTFEEFENAVNVGDILIFHTDLRTKWNTFSQEEKNEYYNKFIEQSKYELELLNSHKIFYDGDFEKFKDFANKITKLTQKECEIYQEFCNEMIKELNENKKDSLSSGSIAFQFLIKSKTSQESVKLECYEKLNDKIKEVNKTKPKSIWSKIFNR